MFNNPPVGTELPSLPKEPEGGIDTYVKKETAFNRLETPVILDPQTATFEDIRTHAQLRQRLAPKTIQNHLKYLRFMELHPCPVDLKNPTHENFLRHMDYREQIEHAGWGSLKHEAEAYKMYLRAIGRNPAEYFYRPPKRQPKEIPVPYPEQVHQMIHTKYSKDRYTDALLRYIIAHNHLIGWRPPSEPAITKLSAVDLDHSTLVVTMPKIHGKQHTIDISEFSGQHDIPSMKNWIEHWRPKVENQHSQDYLYLTPEGKPFTPDGLRHYLYVHARPVIQKIFPQYYNYTSRHWCAISRLIRTKLQTKHFDEFEVMQYMGHTKTDVTMTYIQRAKFYYDQTGYDWIKRVLTDRNQTVGEYAPLIDTDQKTALSNNITPVGLLRRPPDPPITTEENQIDTTLVIWSVDLEPGVSDLSLSFSFYLEWNDGNGEIENLVDVQVPSWSGIQEQVGWIDRTNSPDIIPNYYDCDDEPRKNILPRVGQTLKQTRPTINQSKETNNRGIIYLSSFRVTSNNPGPQYEEVGQQGGGTKNNHSILVTGVGGTIGPAHHLDTSDSFYHFEVGEIGGEKTYQMILLGIYPPSLFTAPPTTKKQEA